MSTCSAAFDYCGPCSCTSRCGCDVVRPIRLVVDLSYSLLYNKSATRRNKWNLGLHQLIWDTRLVEPRRCRDGASNTARRSGNVNAILLEGRNFIWRQIGTESLIFRRGFLLAQRAIAPRPSPSRDRCHWSAVQSADWPAHCRLRHHCRKWVFHGAARELDVCIVRSASEVLDWSRRRRPSTSHQPCRPAERSRLYQRSTLCQHCCTPPLATSNHLQHTTSCYVRSAQVG